MFGFADRIRQIESSGKKVIDLSLGQPEVPAPKHIARALQEAIESPTSSYSASAGSPELRSLIAERYTSESGAPTEASEVIVTNGSKHALFISLLSIVDNGDEVVAFEPYFPPYLEIVELVGGKLKTVPVDDSKTEIKPDLEALFSAISSKTKVLLVNYPNNPSGWTLDQKQIERLADLCSEKGIYLLSDEIYDKIVFDGRKHTPSWTFSKDSDYVIGLGSFSKTYSMVPYRLGFLVARPFVSKEILKSQRATITMVSPYVQAAGIAALRGSQGFVNSRLKKYQERRDKCLAMLRKKRIPISEPKGAFYLFIRLPDKTDGFEFATDLLENESVAVLPGVTFGKRWQNYIRISFATEDSTLYQGLEKIVDAYNRHDLSVPT